jgi:hypothetical protein
MLTHTRTHIHTQVWVTVRQSALTLADEKDVLDTFFEKVGDRQVGATSRTPPKTPTSTYVE